MTEEKSCGAVVFTRKTGELQFVLIRQTNGIRGFPKGHMEPGESEQQTAIREIREETGLSVTLLDGFRETEQYEMHGGTRRKTVIYFLAEVIGGVLAYQPEELTNAAFLDYSQATELLGFEKKRQILKKAYDFLTSQP